MVSTSPMHPLGGGSDAQTLDPAFFEHFGLELNVQSPDPPSQPAPVELVRG
jgi:hypothetical protein